MSAIQPRVAGHSDAATDGATEAGPWAGALLHEVLRGDRARSTHFTVHQWLDVAGVSPSEASGGRTRSAARHHQIGLTARGNFLTVVNSVRSFCGL